MEILVSIPAITVFDLTPLYIVSENWVWDQSGWKPARDNWQAFNNLWYGNVDKDSSVSLDAGDIGAGIQKIIVLPSYLTMFDHVWAGGFVWNYPNAGGFIITGQPGTGVSLLSLLHFQDS